MLKGRKNNRKVRLLLKIVLKSHHQSYQKEEQAKYLNENSHPN